MFLCCSNKIFLPVKLNFQPLCPLQVWWCHTHLSSQSFQMRDKIAEFGRHLQMVLFLWHLSSQSFLRGWDILILFLAFGNRRHLQRCQLWVGWLFVELFSSWTVVVNSCPMCLKVEETVDHLLNCIVTQSSWRALLGWFEYNFVLPHSLFALSWKLELFPLRAKNHVEALFFCGDLERKECWTLWWESLPYRGLGRQSQVSIASWASILPTFWGIPIELFF